jgi:Protein kinase domain/Kelch motif/Galactose oxidase, central domain
LVGLELEQVAAALPSYEIGEELGRGSTGVVLAARHRQLGRDVAIKLLPPELAENPLVRRRFVDEAKLLASFSHVHIVPVYDFVEEEGLCLLVMERLGGGTLDAFARNGIEAPAGCAAVVALCSGLQYAHERGVLHRDVKPGNVLVATDGLVKVTDFGIAKVLGGSETLVTRAGFVLGTPAYMAPEQAKGTEVGPATDIYAAGAVLYELLSGELPFPPEGNPLQMLYSRIHGEPRPLRETAPDVPAPLAEVVMRALEREPGERQASADRLGREIGAAATDAWGPDWHRGTALGVSATLAAGALTEGSHPLEETVTDPPAHSLVPVSALESNGAPPASAPPPAERSEPDGPDRRGRTLLISGVLVLLAGIAAVALLLGGGDDPDVEQAQSPAPTPNTAPASAWQPIASAGDPRQQAPGTMLSGKAWVIGGLGPGPGGTTVALRSVEGLDTTIRQWGTGAPDLPEPIHHAMAATFRGRVVVMGGWIPRGQDLTAISSDRVFELRDQKWVELPRMNSPRVAGAAAVVGDRLVVTGGQANNELVPTTEVFDGKEWKVVSDMPTPREHLAAASDDRYVYAVGGRQLDPGKNLKALERYDPAADSWEPLPDMPEPLGGLGAAIVEGRLVAVGGETTNDVLGTTLVYDIGDETWSRGPALGTPRHGMTVVGTGDTVFAIDGALDAGHTGSTDISEALRFKPEGGS